MSAALWILFWILIVLIAAIVAVVSTPVLLRIRVTGGPKWRLSVAARLFGGLTPWISFETGGGKTGAPTKPEGKQASRTRRKRRSSKWVPRAIGAAPRLISDWFGLIRLDRLAVDADIGLADPAETGQTFGWLSAVTYARPPGSRVVIDIRPDFSGPRASGELDARLRFVPIAFLPPAIRFGWHVFGPRS